MSFFVPEWDIPGSVKVLSTDRLNGYSEGVFNSFNLGLHVGDNPETVEKNRALLPTPSKPIWLEQVHGNQLIELPLKKEQNNTADACCSFSSGQVCVVLTADCLPVLFCNTKGDFVAAVHCGWRGLAKGILAAMVSKYNNMPQELMAWLGPAIGDQAFEVGQDVVSSFPKCPEAFISRENGKFLADIKQIASRQLNDLGVNNITVHPDCTYLEKDKYFSYRRDGQTGRMASLIWFE